MSMMINPYRFAAGGGGGGGIELVGYTGYDLPNSASEFSYSLTGLTGGIASTPQSGDVVILAIANISPSATYAINTAGYVSEVAIVGVDTIDYKLTVFYKVLTAADSAVLIQKTAASVTGAMRIYVLRGVDGTTPLDVATVTATGGNTGRPDPAAITPTTSGSFILVAGVGGYTFADAFTSADLDNFTQQYNESASNKPRVAVGTHAWVTGAFDAAQFGGGSIDARAAWAAASLAFRPA